MEPNTSNPPLTGFEQELVNFFADSVKLFGLPKSVGEIYGLLYASPQELAMDELSCRLNISKGSTSQGLKILRTINAVHENADGRKTLYTANVELKELVGGIVKEQVQPHLKEGKSRLNEMKKLAQQSDDPQLRLFYQERMSKLNSWRRKSAFLLPLINKLLGR